MKIIEEGKLLDVGCRTGNFMFLAKNKGFEPIGIEPSKKFALFCLNNGLKVFNSNLREVNFQDKEFDVITYLEVLEHIGIPSEELKVVYRILRNNGLLIIEVPNVTFQLFKAKVFQLLHIRGFGLMPGDHLVHFSEKTVSLLLKRRGFKILKTMVRATLIYPREPMSSKIFLVLFNYFSRIVKRVFGKNIGNAMVIIAEKKI